MLPPISRPLLSPSVPLRVAAMLALLLASATAMAGAAPDTLEQRIKACTACHATADAGEKRDAFFPRIAGKPAGYLYNQLLNFREGRRRYPLMTYMVDHLPDAYLHEIADYFSSQHPAPPPAQPGTLPDTELTRGRLLVTQGDPGRKLPACIACHGEKLAGLAPAVPGLLGLPRDYINAQFGAWKTGVRRAKAPDCMATIASRLADADVAAISGWLATQVARPDARPAEAPAAPLPLACGSIPAEEAR